MTKHEFDALIARLEIQAARDPAAYQRFPYRIARLYRIASLYRIPSSVGANVGARRCKVACSNA